MEMPPPDVKFVCGCELKLGFNEAGERTAVFIACPDQLDCEVVQEFKARAEEKKRRDPNTKLIVKETQQ
jgi:hypothetical protein